ncbi:UNVERIFIED_CONTAM: hypothetical protein H355_010198 [Colinus virginianus]|nr:hypothetical protein H355_010198 [Colinus virginianus]
MEDFHPHNDEMIFNADEAHNIVKELENRPSLKKATWSWEASIFELQKTCLDKVLSSLEITPGEISFG